MRYLYSISNAKTKIKTKANLIVTSLVVGIGGLLIGLGIAFGASAASPPMATGSVGWMNGGAQAYDSFDAHQTSATCSVTWNAAGTYQINVEYLSVNYPETLVLTQTGTAITGGTLNTVPPSAASAFNVTSGTVLGNSIDIYANQVTSTLVVHLSGAIAPDGSMAGTWADVSPGTRTGTWASTSGTANLSGCTGFGSFSYTDSSGITYLMNVQYVSVDGNQAWFAGPTVSGNFGIGTWIFIEVQDNGQPGIGSDQIWGQVVAGQTVAQYDVASHQGPAGGPFILNDGNLVVH